MKRCKLFALSLSLLLLAAIISGCASNADTQYAELGGFTYDQNGYGYTSAPFGSTLEETEKSLGFELEATGNPVSEPIAYQLYLGTAPLSVLDLQGGSDVQISDQDELFCFSFHTQLSVDEAEDQYADIHEQFLNTFGTPTEDSDNGAGTRYTEWQDKASGTCLSLYFWFTGSSDATLSISVFEKSRYVDAGVGKWAE